MGLIRNAPCSPDLGDGFTYPEHSYKLCRNFSSDTQNNTWQNVLAQKNFYEVDFKWIFLKNERISNFRR